MKSSSKEELKNGDTVVDGVLLKNQPAGLIKTLNKEYIKKRTKTMKPNKLIRIVLKISNYNWAVLTTHPVSGEFKETMIVIGKKR